MTSAGGLDLRLVAVGLVAWLGSLSGGAAAAEAGWRWGAGVAAAVVGVAVAVVLSPAGRPLTVAALVAAFGATATVAAVARTQSSTNPVAALAARHALVEVTLVVTRDPRHRDGRFSDYVVLRGRVDSLRQHGVAGRVHAPILVVGAASWSAVALGERVTAVGRLSPSTQGDLSGVLQPRGGPTTRAPPAWWWRASAVVRAALTDATSGLSPAPRALVPALVVGDDSGLDPALAEDFRATGLTHLLAVSGTNLTLVVGFLVVAARWGGVRGRGLRGVGALGIVAFVVLARPEPSVLRAAVMGAVALVGLGTRSRGRGPAALGFAVTALLLVDPGLARQPGFALSVLATAGIVLAAPPLRDALATWLPRPLAEALAIPAAAQLACQPVVAAISGQVSLVAVLANLLAGPAVGPATVLGLAAGLLDLVWAPLGAAVARAAGLCVGWVVAVAEHGARLPTAAVGWGSDVGPVLLLSGVSLAALGVGPAVARRRWLSLLVGGALVLVVVVRPPAPGWPPAGWVFAACDVGQGDGLVLRAGPGLGVVVDTGPDPALMDRCLRRLGVRQVPLVLLTHFHADHVGGLSGVLRGRRVGRVEVTAYAAPPDGVADVAAAASAARVPLSVPAYGTVQQAGAVRLQIVGPDPGMRLPPVSTDREVDGSHPNNASLVVVAEVDGVRLLLAGDVEPAAQSFLVRTLGGVRVDVLKVPHHGSRYQEDRLLCGVGASVAVISVGADNDYGHPASSVVEELAGCGAAVRRTDRDGDVVVVSTPAGIAVRSSR